MTSAMAENLDSLVGKATVLRVFDLSPHELARLVRNGQFPAPTVRLTTRRWYWKKEVLAKLMGGEQTPAG